MVLVCIHRPAASLQPTRAGGSSAAFMVETIARTTLELFTSPPEFTNECNRDVFLAAVDLGVVVAPDENTGENCFRL